MSDLDKVLQSISESLFEKMDALLPEVVEGPQGRLNEAMRYSDVRGKKAQTIFDCNHCKSFWG